MIIKWEIRLPPKVFLKEKNKKIHFKSQVQSKVLANNKKHINMIWISKPLIIYIIVFQNIKYQEIFNLYIKKNKINY